ncbi:NERD domain-containing protein [Ornithinibacillus sp. L9]|uniref:NERD domain-containing protein n=1 Tax=Ornithinibacillus caprae TaxID=2678566 RepID=A0A6N8FAV5_9BACI|nr:NERD domain-containing protein [Ornithinibacillus caprae]MUK86792.1 NERD domain-containing protein [Ornithinibacillus caprae]
MAQLIKLQNYISRYEWNIYRYPSQYIRLKQENWNKLYYIWSNQENQQHVDDEEEKVTRFSKWKSFMKRSQESEPESEDPVQQELPHTETELKYYFLDKIYPFQLKWATSTISNVSFMDQKYYKDATLQYFLQRFPDTYLVMYYPIFNIKNAPVDGEIVLISPVGIEIIYLLEDDRNTVYTVKDERTWTKRHERSESKFLSPLIALKRSEKIINSILSKYDISFSVTKTVLSRTNRIDFVSEPYNTNIIDKFSYEKWFETKRTLVSPLKNQQLKAAEQLLNHCQSSSVKRPEWEEDDQSFTIVGEE